MHRYHPHEGSLAGTNHSLLYGKQLAVDTAGMFRSSDFTAELLSVHSTVDGPAANNTNVQLLTVKMTNSWTLPSRQTVRFLICLDLATDHASMQAT